MSEVEYKVISRVTIVLSMKTLNCNFVVKQHGISEHMMMPLIHPIIFYDPSMIETYRWFDNESNAEVLLYRVQSDLKE